MSTPAGGAEIRTRKGKPTREQTPIPGHEATLVVVEVAKGVVGASTYGPGAEWVEVVVVDWDVLTGESGTLEGAEVHLRRLEAAVRRSGVRHLSVAQVLKRGRGCVAVLRKWSARPPVEP